MAYARKNWKDHVVTQPRTYTEATNPDGSKTFTPAPGEVLQQGTPQSATNFNSIEEAIQHYGIAFDMMYTIAQAQAREITTLKEQLAAMTT